MERESDSKKSSELAEQESKESIHLISRGAESSDVATFPAKRTSILSSGSFLKRGSTASHVPPQNENQGQTQTQNPPQNPPQNRSSQAQNHQSEAQTAQDQDQRADGDGEEAPRRRYPVLSERNPDEIKHFVKQIYSVTIPVMMCIVLVIWWVQIRETYMTADASADPFGFVAIDGDSRSSQISQGVINALIIIASIIGVTIVFVILFWFGFHQVLLIILVFTVVVTLGGQGGLFIWYELQAVNVPMDYITFSFVLWNFTVVGLWVVFKSGPLRVQQAYLIILSALMAFVFTQIDEWTTWVLLAFLVLWDLFAVLTPCGPLKLLIEASQRQNVDIPALLYSTMIFMMADDNIVRKKKVKVDEEVSDDSDDSDDGEDVEEAQEAAPAPAAPAAEAQRRRSKKEKKERKERKERKEGKERKEKKEGREKKERKGEKEAQEEKEPKEPMEPKEPKEPKEQKHKTERQLEEGGGGDSSSTALVSLPQTALSPTERVQQELAQNAEQLAAQAAGQDGEEEDSDGLKLGLGDFVFYSVLVGRAALTDWTTLVACIIAVLTGLNGTILLLAIFQKALPALPISLTLGLLFYFLTSLVVAPFENILQMHQIFV